MIELVIFVVLMLSGYIFGQLAEQSHYKSIRQRENALRSLPLIASKILPDEFSPCNTRLVAGNVVISVDFFKKFVAGLRGLFGGRIITYETLVDRARREALLRMREEAKRAGAHYVFNVKMETSTINKGQRDAVASIEVLAYGTAIILANPQPTATTGTAAATSGDMNFRPR